MDRKHTSAWWDLAMSCSRSSLCAAWAPPWACRSSIASRRAASSAVSCCCCPAWLPLRDGGTQLISPDTCNRAVAVTAVGNRCRNSFPFSAFCGT